VDWKALSDASQVALTIITAIGVMVSLAIGRRTLAALHDQRLQNVRPYLCFDLGAQSIPVELKDIDGVPGLDYQYVRRIRGPRPPGPNCLTASRPWGHLRNHGNGSALNSWITFIPIRAFVGNDDFAISQEKRQSFPYSASANKIPAHPSHIVPGSEASFMRLPTPIVTDYDRKMSRLVCIVHIQYQDMYGNEFSSFQGVRVWLDELDKQRMAFTFLEEIKMTADNVPKSID
jgi:hypothetical protein